VKQKRIKFEFRPNAMMARDKNLFSPYRCMSITESTEINPGDWFDKRTVDEYCADRNWAVTIVAEDS
jgi:hypothetical protein